MTDRVFRYSEMRRFKRCRRSWLDGYVLGWRKPEFSGDYKPTKANTGTLVHSDLEAYYSGQTSAPGEFHRTQTPPVSESFGKEWTEVYLLAQIMLDGFAEWLTEEGQDQGESTLFTEKALEVPLGTVLGDNVSIAVHIDRVVLDETFNRYIVEDFKTVDSLTHGVQFATDEQLLTYAWAVQEGLGLPVAECRHTSFRRVKRSARATPPFYGREGITPTPDLLRNHVAAMLATAEDMVRCLQDPRPEVFYPNNTRDCSWDCDFLAVCAMHDDGSDLEAVMPELYVQRSKETK